MAITATFLADFDAFIASTQGAERALKQLDAGGKGLGQTFDTMKGIAGQLAGAFGLAFSASALVGFARGAIESAAKLGDLAAATGVTTDSLQRLASVGAGFGVNIDEIARAVGNLSTRLAGGDPSAVAAVDSLGLNIQRLIASGPTEAFLTIAEAAGRVEDPMMKGSIASALFGDKLAKVLIPALGDLRTKMQEVPQDTIISKATIASANEFEASIKHGVTRLEAWAAKILFAWSAGSKAAAEQKKAIDDIAKAQAGLAETTGPVITTAQLLENRLKALRSEALEPLTKAQKATAGELLLYGTAQKEIAQLLGVSESAIRLFTEAEKAAAEEMKRAAAEAEKFADIIAGLGRDAFAKSQKEFDEWSARLTITTDRVTAAILKESEAQTALNASHGLTALGANKVASAEETLRLGLEALHRTKEGSIAQTAQEQLLMNAYTKALYDAAAGTDTVNRSTSQIPAVAGPAIVAVNNLTTAYWAQVDAMAAASGIPSIGHRAGEAGSGIHESPRGAPINTGAGANSFVLNKFKLPGFAGGGPVLRDGPIYAHAGEFVTPKGGGGATVVNNFYVNGTAEDVASQIADKVLRTVMRSTKLGLS